MPLKPCAFAPDLCESKSQRDSQPQCREECRDAFAVLRDEEVNQQKHTRPDGENDQREDNVKIYLRHERSIPQPLPLSLRERGWGERKITIKARRI